MVKKAGAGLMVEGREVKSQELHAVERGGEPGTACSGGGEGRGARNCMQICCVGGRAQGHLELKFQVRSREQWEAG